MSFTRKQAKQLIRLNSLQVECWHWTGKIEKGHPVFRTNKKYISAKAISSFGYKNTPIDQCLRFNHPFCNNKLCVNPKHLYIRTVFNSINNHVAIKKFILLNCIKDKESKCWNWIGDTDKDGYGRIAIQKKTYKIRRLSAAIYLDFDITRKDLFICHHCDNPSCNNPNHLFITTQYKHL